MLLAHIHRICTHLHVASCGVVMLHDGCINPVILQWACSLNDVTSVHARASCSIPDMLKLVAGGGFVLDDARITTSRITAAMEADNLGAALEAWQHFQQVFRVVTDLQLPRE